MSISIELQKFLEEIYTDIQAALFADEDGATQEEKFTEYVVDMLTEAGETDGVRIASYLKENKQEHIVKKINGYAFNEEYETVDIFITSYYHSKNYYTLTRNELNKLINRSKKFVNDGLKRGAEDIEESNPAYEAAEVLLNERNNFIRLNIFILTNAQVVADSPTVNSIKSFENLHININIWDNERIFRLKQSRNNREPIELDFYNDFKYDVPCLEMPSTIDKYDCYVAILPGTLLADLYKNFGTKLLENNVRSFLQQTGKVNRGIRDTIRHEPEMFLPYNNGLAATAENLQTDRNQNGQKLIKNIRDFQIVNGGQTTASLFHTQKKWKDSVDLDQVYVQMKLTVIKDEEKREEIVPYISRYANSQNKVSEVDLTANNPFLQKIEELSQRIYALDPYDRNKQTLWFFERVKGQYKEALNREPTKSKKNAFKNKFPSNQKITKSELAKYMNIWNMEPYTVSKGSQKNYMAFMKRVQENPKKIKPNRIYFEDLVANAILFRTTDKLFGSKRSGNNIGDTSIKSYTVNYTVSYFHYLTDQRPHLGEIWKLQNLPNSLQNELQKLLYFIYNFLTSESDSLVSEFAKKQSTWENLKNKNENIINKDKINYLLHTEDSWKKRYEGSDEDDDNLRLIQENNYLKEFGVKFWKGLEVWGYEKKQLTPQQRTTCDNIVAKIKKNTQLTKKECKKGKNIIELARNLNLDFEAIKDLSPIKNENYQDIDTVNIYNRIKNISREDWKRIIAILEKTKQVEGKVISITRSVSKKALNGENISDRMLSQMSEVLNIANKFGINV